MDEDVWEEIIQKNDDSSEDNINDDTKVNAMGIPEMRRHVEVEE